MNKPTLLESQHAQHSSHPGYGQAHPGMHIRNLDDSNFVDPTTLGLEIDTAAIEAFVAERGADPDHFRYATLNLYRSDSGTARIPGASQNTSRRGFVNKNWLVTEAQGGVRFPNIGIAYGEGCTEEDINFTLRHELGHLLLPEHTPLYNRRYLIGRIRTGMLVGNAALLTTIGDLFNTQTIEHLHYGEGYPPQLLGAIILGTTAVAAAGVFANGIMATRSHGVMRFFDRGERRADTFAEQHADFNPIRVIRPAATPAATS